MADVNFKMELLERTVLELGTELFNLKGMVAKTTQSHERFLTIMKGLQLLLDEKGLITREDFEAAVELGQAVDTGDKHYDDYEDAEDKAKKHGH